MQLRHDFQVGGQHPHFCSRAQFQLAALVDVERLVGAVGLHPHPRTIRVAFEQGEAVTHLLGAGRRQQMFTDQAHFCGEGRVRKIPQVLTDAGLQLPLQGTGRRQIQTVEVIQRAIEQSGQTTAGDTDALVGFDGLKGRLLGPVTIGHSAGQRCIRQRLINDIVLRQQADMAVSQLRQLFATSGQIMRRPTLGDHQ